MAIFICSKCQAQFPKWLGQCPQCNSWGTISQQKDDFFRIKDTEIIDFEKIVAEKILMTKTGIEEVDRVLGGGLAPESLILLGGQPGIGKSTLVLQIASRLIDQQIFYISGEESAQQVKARLNRLNLPSTNWKFLGETDIELISRNLEKYKPGLIIIDSIQTMFFRGLDSEPGSINQIRACVAKLKEVAQKIKATILIISHVTKEGLLAGPKTLEHLVDVVLYLEGAAEHHFRFLRAVKNRFGSTNEVGVFDMQTQGLIEVKNPSEVFLANRDAKISGSVITPVIEGSRSFLIEVQALVSKTVFGYPQRKSTGFDLNRLGLLIAVLTKRCGLSLSNQDIHINIVAGLQIREPGVDLGVGLAIVSAFKNTPIDSRTAVFGEVGLGGEIRGVKNAEKRIKEAEKMGFDQIICPLTKDIVSKIKIIQIKNLNEAIARLFNH